MTSRIVLVQEPARRRLRRAVLAVAALVLLAGAGLGARAWGPDAQAAPTAGGSVRAVLVSGSSLSYADAARTADRLGWQLSAYTLPGAGFSRTTHDPARSITGTVRGLLPVAGPGPDVVVLQGGEADHAAAPAVLERATQHLLDYVQAHAGAGAVVVLVGPIPGSTVPPSTHDVNDVLQAVAASRGVTYVDAVAQGWQARDAALPTRLADALAAATGR